mmetsp:Transcript_24430/g.36645  ORF Transcript_24430/g.36645 Transcript_24430/m.36645 type:complete len:149 (+) Transcript_24430:212-658(+)
MGRMYSQGKGLSSSVIPYRRHSCEWKGLTTGNLIKLITKLSKKGLTNSQIGTVLRDSFSIIDVRNILGMNISRLLSMKGLSSDIPEDLYFISRKWVKILDHYKKFPKDLNAKFKLKHVESHVQRIARYYKTAKKIPENWELKKIKNML